MKIKKINSVQLDLLDGQVEIILKSLELYCLSANFLLDRKGKYTSKESEMQISLITDTYEQISSQIYKTKENNKKIKKVS